MTRLSIRARITIGSVVVAALLLLGALIVVRAQVSTILSDADKALAIGDLASFQKDIASDPTAEVDDPGTGVLVYVRSPTGTIEVNTLPHDLVEVVAPRSAETSEFSVGDDEGRAFVVAARMVATPEGTWALWAARSTSSSELALEGLDRVLVIGGILLLSGFGAAAWFLTTTALRPVARLRREAESLGHTLEGALPVGRSRDEISALAVTLNDLLDRLRGSSAREKQMISDAAHELRTPLASLTTQLELAHADEDDASALAAHLRGAEESAARLSGLARNLLELNRVESTDRADVSSSTSRLVDELMGAVDRGRMLGLPRAVQIGFEIAASDAEQSYAISPDDFGRVVDNLVVNAVHAVNSGSGGGSVHLAFDEGPSGLQLSVTDDGPGMPEDFIPRAFERFARPDDSRARSDGGSGLGLALVHAVVQAADGSIELTNRHPGLEVRVRIPKM